MLSSFRVPLLDTALHSIIMSPQSVLACDIFCLSYFEEYWLGFCRKALTFVMSDVFLMIGVMGFEEACDKGETLLVT
jgi:hypothetical protein